MYMYDIVIVGGGPAGLTAAIYAARAGKHCCVIEKDFCGGMINNSAKVENIPGFTEISGLDFAENLILQAEQNGVEIIYDEVINVIKYVGLEFPFCTITTADEHYKSKAVILATGTKHKTLGLEKEDQFIGNGIHFCAFCDGMFYEGRNVIVVGGGNSALTEALYLSKICNTVTIIQNLDHLTGDKVLQDKINNTENIYVKLNKEIIGYLFNEDNEIAGLKLNTGPVAADGIFICIGLKPYPNITDNLINYDKNGFMLKPNSAGIFFAGDCTAGSSIKQVVTACASGADAAVCACKYIDYETTK